MMISPQGEYLSPLETSADYLKLGLMFCIQQYPRQITAMRIGYISVFFSSLSYATISLAG